ncbi:hypothetical protein N431DRAFT_134788 [Stipitochalara longipes BDJ]|nr:hypothetical protein N431DRAFT_134788 [Stipitochalara longipes BDJ]
MKFFTVAAVSFSLGCQVFAAPIEVPSAPIPAPVAGIAAHLETVAGGAVAGAEALPPVSALTTAAAPITPNTGLPIVKKSIDITTITTSISSLKSSVSPELSAIMSFSASNVTTYAVPAIKSHLETIATHIHETVITLGPALVGSGEALAVGEAEALLEALADLESLVFSIKSTFSSTLAIVKSGKSSLSSE